MALSETELRELLVQPQESLGLELKGWIDPATDDGMAKLARGCIALRNNNGGVMVIGFNDDSLPDPANAPADVRATFHPDVIQSIVTRFSAEPFTVDVQLGESDGKLYPVISVPTGVHRPSLRDQALTFFGTGLHRCTREDNLRSSR
jgi:hypothetical protein